MASPQLEHGHIKIANELFEAINRHGFNGAQYGVLLGYIRMTYGFNRKEARMTLRELTIMAHLSERSVSYARKQLRDANVLTELGINKDYESWKPVVARSCDKSGTELRQVGNAIAEPYSKDKRQKTTGDGTHNLAPSNAIGLVLGYFCESFEKKLGRKYIISRQKDTGLIKTMLSTLKPLEIRSLIDAFFASTDKFILGSGHTVGVFYSQINKLNTVVTVEPNKYYIP